MNFNDYIGRPVRVLSDVLTKGKEGVIESFTDDIKACVDFNNGFVGYYRLNELEFLDEPTEDTEGLDIELLDRLDTTLKLIDMLLIDHKRAVHYGVADKIEEASGILADVYQEVGGKVL